MKTVFTTTFLALCVSASGGALAAKDDDTSKEINPNKVHHRVHPGDSVGHALTAGSTASLSAITNHGGPVMGGAPDVHLIWYGNWAQANGSDNAGGQTIVRDFMKAYGGSNYSKINTMAGGYTGTSSTAISGNLGRVAEANVGYIAGTRAKKLRDSDIATVVSNYVQTVGGASTNAIYFVLTSSDVTATSGFCTQYCGWHTKGTIGGVANVKYSFVGNANRCLGSCAPQTVGPNGNAGVDGMVSVLAHELVETLSDPLLNAWYDAAGAENADKCAWTYGGAQLQAANGAWFNMTLPTATGSRQFLIQRNLAVNSRCYVDGVTLQQ